MVALVAVWFQIPRVSTVDQEAGVFSSDRVIEHIERIATAPRAIGSEGHASAGEYIRRTLEGYGIDVDVQESVRVGNGPAGEAQMTRVRNLLARVKGTSSDEAILLSAHYDSTPYTTGASDNASSVAVLLEVVRAISRETLKRDIIVLFDDAEEAGSHGAKAFVEEHRWARRIKVVLNFDARGSSGPVLMFEANKVNTAMLDAVATISPSHSLSSLYSEVYYRMPNNTSFTTFRRAGFAGLNFANIGSPQRYHTMLDRVEAVDRGTLSQKGSYALALTRWFGRVQSLSSESEELIFFDVLGRAIVRYPASWSHGIAVLLGAWVLTLSVWRITQRAVSIRGAVLSIGLHIGLIVASFALAMLVLRVIVLTDPFAWYASGSYTAAMVCWTLLVVFVAYDVVAHRSWGITGVEMLVANVWLWLLVLLGASIYVRGASYLPAVVVGASLVALTAHATLMRASIYVQWAVFSLCGAVIAVIAAPVLYLIAVALHLDGAPLIAAATALVTGAVSPQLWILTKYGRGVTIAGATVALSIHAKACVQGDFGRETPKHASLSYLADGNDNRAMWLSTERTPNPVTAQYLGPAAVRRIHSEYFDGRRELWSGPAEVLPVWMPEAEVVGEGTVSGERRLRVRVRTGAAAAQLWLDWRETRGLVRIAVDGIVVSAPRQVGEHDQFRWNLRYASPLASGLLVDAELLPGAQMRLSVMSAYFGLPAASGGTPTLLPNDFIPRPDGLSDMTFARKSYVF